MRKAVVKRLLQLAGKNRQAEAAPLLDVLVHAIVDRILLQLHAYRTC